MKRFVLLAVVRYYKKYLATSSPVMPACRWRRVIRNQGKR